MPNLWPDCSDDVTLTDHQKEVLKKATASPFGILNGSPGTGKSFTAAVLIKRVIARHGAASIAICAPTGKAAVRCAQAMAKCGLFGMKATTIHRLLGIDRNGHDGDGWGFIHNRGNPLPFRFLVVDESSMIDSSIAAAVLCTCKDGTHILWIGDTGQLAPVGHGAPFRDLIDSGTVGYGELSEVHRNAGMIVAACRDIKDGKDFEAADRVDLEAKPPVNLKMMEARSEAIAVASLDKLLTSMKRFDPVWETQVIVPRNSNRRCRGSNSTRGYSSCSIRLACRFAGTRFELATRSFASRTGGIKSFGRTVG